MARSKPVDDARLLLAYERGRQEGLISSMPFQGRRNVVDFPPGRVLPDSVISYEQRLLRAIPERHRRIRNAQDDVDAARHLLAVARARAGEHEAFRRDGGGLMAARRHALASRRARQEAEEVAAECASSEAQLELIREHLEWVYEELTRVRLWLDSLVQTAEAYSAVRPGLRRTPEPEPPPENVRIYSSADEYVAEKPARASGEWSSIGILDGADFGYDWTWADFDRPWITTEWRVSYIEELGEVYAVMIRPDSDAGQYWQAPGGPIRAPVWLFDQVLPSARWSSFALSTSPAWEWLSRLQRDLMHQPNSLLVLAEALREVPDAVLRGLTDPAEEWHVADEEEPGS